MASRLPGRDLICRSAPSYSSRPTQGVRDQSCPDRHRLQHPSGDNEPVFGRSRVPQALDASIAAVVFTATDADMHGFKVSDGPCIPLAPGAVPLCEPILQDVGETPPMTTALYAALTGRPPKSALMTVARSGRGTLSRCADDFAAAMAEASRTAVRLANEDEARGDEELTTFTAFHKRLDAAWLRVGPWPEEVVSVWPRLVRLGIARIAEESGTPVYVWHGPSATRFRIVSGHGPYPGTP